VLTGAWQEPRFRSGTNTVSIYATVVDRDGHLVTNLQRDDFSVFDDGKLQPLSVFANDLQAITAVLMIDRSTSAEDSFDLVRDAAAEFVDNLVPGDRAKIGSFSEAIRIDPERFTADREELHRILRENLQPDGPTPLWNATSAAMDALSGEEGRRVVLLFTDGKDTPDPGRSVTFDQLLARVQIDDAIVYGIGLAGERCVSLTPLPRSGGILYQRPSRPRPRGPSLPGPIRRPPGLPRILPPLGGTPPWTRPTEPATEADRRCFRNDPDPHLRTLAEAGGGGYFELDDADDLRATFTRIANELHHQYVLAYPVPVLDGKPHRIEVRVRKSGAIVRARRAYVAPGE
jgi:VWFA-related protein